jgi:adenylyl-sulfate kinase
MLRRLLTQEKASGHTMSVGTTSAGFTVWFTGMAGSGKSTLAQALAQRLKRLGWNPEILDGAEVSQMLGVGAAQTKDERNNEARRLGWVCKLITRGGGMVFQSAIQSPNREARDEARRQIGRFVEVFVDCQIDLLISRDRTGQYKKALTGELKNLPGITEPYEPPTHPEILVDTGKQNVDEAIEHIIGQLSALRYIDATQAGLKSRPKLNAQPKIPLRPPPLVPVPQPVLYKPPPKGAGHAHVAHAAHAHAAKEEHKAAARAAEAKLALKPVALKQVPAKAGKPPAAPKAEKPAKAMPKPKLVVAKKPAAKPAPKVKSRPAARPAHHEARRAAGGRKR